MKAYLESLVDWLLKWRLKMNASKCCYTIFSQYGRGNLELNLQLNGEPIPYNPNQVFLGITFDQTIQNRTIRCIFKLKWDRDS